MTLPEPLAATVRLALPEGVWIVAAEPLPTLSVAPLMFTLPPDVILLLLLKKLISPVLASPSCSVCLLVVARMPLPDRDVALLPELAEILAVGTPELTLMNANFAELVALFPSNRSCVV